MAEDIKFTEQARSTITIMRPMPSVVPRGTASFEKQSPTRSIRMKESELLAIEEAASLLGMTKSAFMKWCSYYAAMDVINQHKEYMRKRSV
jgi:hypothetical protein